MRASSLNSLTPVSASWLDGRFTKVRNVFGMAVLAGFLGAGAAQAQIQVGSLQNFSTQPRTNEWCTAGRTGTANAAGSFVDALTLEADVQAVVNVDVVIGALASDP